MTIFRLSSSSIEETVKGQLLPSFFFTMAEMLKSIMAHQQCDNVQVGSVQSWYVPHVRGSCSFALGTLELRLDLLTRLRLCSLGPGFFVLPFRGLLRGLTGFRGISCRSFLSISSSLGSSSDSEFESLPALSDSELSL